MTGLPAETLFHELKARQIELEVQNETLRQAQTVLEESRDCYFHTYEYAPIGYFDLTLDGKIAEANLTGAKMLGVERNRLMRRRFAGYVMPEDQNRWHQYFMSKSQNGEISGSCDLAFKRDDGLSFHARLDSMSLNKSSGSPLVCITLVDISEQKRVEEALRITSIAFESEAGVLITDANKVILQLNRAFTQLTGYSTEDALGKTPAIFNSGRMGKEFYQLMWISIKEQGRWQGEVWNKHKNGTVYVQWVTISAVYSSDKEPTHYIATYFDISNNREAESEIHRLAYYDPLTQLPNRRLLQDRLSQALSATQRNGRFGAVLFLDMDNFKTLNDTRGHDIGDLFLVEVALRLRACVRREDTVARLGGDEFVVLLEDLGTEAGEVAAQAKLVGEKVSKVLGQHYLLKDYEFHGSASIGVCLFCGQDTVEDLLKHADVAMYQAKAAGRNALRFYDPAMQAALDERSALEADLRLACPHSQLLLFYQLQMDKKHGVIGAEVLLRWMHLERGLVVPNDFIPLAEETGLILPIGQWVLETACAQIKTWESHELTKDLRLAVNVSARQFHQTDFVAQVKRVLTRSGANPTRLKIELTESLVLSNVADTIIKMQELKAIGVSFSMDDFGTGYSSLSYLARLPLDQLKIDQSFIQDIGTNTNCAAIVQTIINMGKTLGLNVIAEGVETKMQMDFLDLNGCHSFQGYFFSQPVPLAEFERFLK